MTDGEYTNFDLKVERWAKPCIDSGIMFDIHESPQYLQIYETGPEMQIADLACTVPDRRSLYQHAGDMLGLIAVRYESVKPAGQLNNYEIKADHGHVLFFTNGHEAVNTQIWTPAKS